MKKFLSLVLAFAMVFSLCVIAFAVERFDGKTIILHTNDVHGAIDKYAYVAGIKQELENKGAEVILADAGDYLQGSVNVSDSKGEAAVTMMNAVGYDIVTIGNHEFDYGYANLKEKLSAATFSVVCSNVYDGENTIFDDSYTYTTDEGMKIGFFGMETPETLTKSSPLMTKGLTFTLGDKLFDVANKEAEKLQNADVVICLAHLGVENASAPARSIDLYKNTTGIDFIIDGHSHTVMTSGPDGEKIQSTGTGLANVGAIVIDNATKTIDDNYLIPIDESTPCDMSVMAISDKILNDINEAYGAPFAKNEVELNGEKAPGNRTMETNLGDLITDCMLSTALKSAGDFNVPKSNIVAIVNGGSIRAWLHTGDISKKDVNTVLPFGNTISVVYVTGAQMLEAIEASTFAVPDANGGFAQVSGIKYTVNSYNEYDANEDVYPGSTYHGPASIQRVKINSVNGKRFDKNALYAVVTSNFCAAGGDTYYAFASAATQFDTGIALDEALMDYITEDLGGVIGSKYAAPQGRITINTEKPTGIKALIQTVKEWLGELEMMFNEIISTFFGGIC